MGGFILNLVKNASLTDLSFIARNQIESYEKNTEQFCFKKYKKSLLKTDAFIFNSNIGVVLGCGTISYKSLGVLNGFKQLASDILFNKFDPNELFGHFSLIYFNDKIINIYFDEAGYGAPFVVDNRYISSSFLSCIDYLESIQLNHDAIFEEIFTGCYFDGKTTFKEIRKITKKEEWNINNLIIRFTPIVHKTSIKKDINKENAVDKTINVLNSYFNRWIPIINHQLGDLGLSSGFDSRLMLGLTQTHYVNNYQVHSYWKKNKDFDNIVAEKLATIVKKDLIRIPIKERNSLSVTEFEKLINDAMIYYDGLFPCNHGWVREYRTSAHRIKILNKSKFGFSGISGEQYRNDYNLFNKSFSINYIINNIILEDRNDEILRASKFYNKGMDIINRSLVSYLKLNKGTKRLTRFEFQRFYCEMWVPGGPGIRNRIENNLTYFLSPFTERINQKEAYRILKYLGLGGGFQAKMIAKINKELSKVVSDYGFPFDRIKFKNKALWFLSAIIGRKNKINIATKLRPKTINYIDSFGVHSEIVRIKLDRLTNYGFEFPIKSSKFKQDTIDRLIALSTLLDKYESKIEK